MKNNYTQEEIINCIMQFRNGRPAREITKKNKIPKSTFYYWVKKYKGIKNPEDIAIKSTLIALQRKFEKLKQVCEILQIVNCNAFSPLKDKLYEMETLIDKYSIRTLCSALNVSRGTFYNHLLRNKKENTSYSIRRKHLATEIQKIYEESHGLFGSDKILSILYDNGIKTSKKMVREIMNQLGIRSFRSKAKKDYMLWNKLHERKNILQQNFTVDAPNLAWVGDCTQFNLFQKTFYFCAIIDLFSRKVISYKLSTKSSTQLATTTLKEAIEKRHPTNQLVFHSDRGCQYTSYAFRKLLIEEKITQSLSRKANPFDNSVIESFFSSLKQEEIYRTTYRSYADLKKRLNCYIVFYNENRPHRANNYKTPNYIEKKFYEKLDQKFQL